MIVEPVGDTGLRLRFDGALITACGRARSARAAIAEIYGDRLRDAWQGARSLMLDLHEPPSAEDLTAIGKIAGTASGRELPDPMQVTTVPVRYDGADLDEIAQRCGLSVDEVIRVHSTAAYTLAFIGFAPGFPYLFGTPEPLAAIPRRDSPRPRVPRNALAIAGGWTGIYPSEMPGGWHLLGTLEQDIFDQVRLQSTDWQRSFGFRFAPA